MTRQTVTVLMGAPAAGKSTWCESNAGDATVIPVDAIKKGANPAYTFTIARLRAKKALSRGEDVIIDACSTRWRDRATWVSVAREYGARTVLVVFDTPVSVCTKRDSLRKITVGRADTYDERMRYAVKRIKREPWDEVIFAKGY